MPLVSTGRDITISWESLAVWLRVWSRTLQLFPPDFWIWSTSRNILTWCRESVNTGSQTRLRWMLKSEWWCTPIVSLSVFIFVMATIIITACKQYFWTYSLSTWGVIPSFAASVWLHLFSCRPSAAISEWTRIHFHSVVNVYSSFNTIMESMTPLLVDSEVGLELSRWLNAAQILTAKLINRLKDIAENEVSLETLLGEASELRAYLQTAINLPAGAVNTLFE